MRGVHGVHGAINPSEILRSHTHTENPALMCFNLGKNPQNKEKER